MGDFFSTNLTNPERIKYLGLFFRKNTAIAGVFSSLVAFSKYVCCFFYGQIFPSISPQWETTIKFICLSTHKKTSKIFPIASSDFLWYTETNGWRSSINLIFYSTKKKYNFSGITNVVERKTDLRDTEYIAILFYS